jgi:predicted SnoaL-like aldol condensation-catalyzing enzyme
MSSSNKQTALDFLSMVVGNQVDAAFEKHVDMSGKHHNIHTPAGFPALCQGMKDSDVQFPNKQFKTFFALEEGDKVAVYSSVILKPKELEVAVTHIFRFADGKIVEMWDVGMILPTEVINADGAF